MIRRIVPLLLTLAVAEAAWLLAARFLLRQPWDNVNKGVVAVGLGFLTAHVLAGWSERGGRSADGKDDDRR